VNRSPPMPRRITRGRQVPLPKSTAHRWRIFCSRLRRRIRFLRHFQRIFPRFFQAREERFTGSPAPA